MCELKTCKTCNKEFPATTEFFHYRNDIGKLQPRCRKCLNKSKCSGKLEAKRVKIKKELETGKLKCKTCGEPKALDEFRVHKESLSGRGSSCKQCESKKSREEYGSDILKSREYSVCKSFNITPVQYRMFMDVNNCQLCGREFKPISESYRTNRNIDHCHETGKIRGVLCNGCNVALGNLGDTVEGLEKAITYLKNNNYGKL